jgi:hypothetical protein
VGIDIDIASAGDNWQLIARPGASPLWHRQPDRQRELECFGNIAFNGSSGITASSVA